MKKSIFLFFAAILCAVSVQAEDLFLRGDFNSWGSGAAEKFTDGSGTVNVALSANTTYKFLVANSGWGTKYGAADFTADATKTLTQGGADMSITTTFNGTYTFTFDLSTKKLTVTYPKEEVPVETHDITIKAKYPATWTAGKAAIHFWGTGVTGATPAAMTKDGDWWTYTVTGVPTTSPLSVIFINGDNWNGDANQTVDITGITENTCFEVSQSGNAKGTAVKADCETGEAEVIETHDITVKAFYPASWNAGKAAVHFWGDGVASPGTPAAMEKDGDWWTYTVTGVPTTSELSVIFINGDNWNGDANQTVDITGITESTCYQVTAGSGKASAAVVDCASTPIVAEDVYTVVGSDNLFGSAWSPAAEANDMEKQGDGSYKKVYSNVELTSDVIWKIAKNDDWWNGPTFNANNNTLSIAKSGIYNVTFVLSADLATADAEAELLEETNTVADCYISGNAALTGGAGWAGNEFKMEYDEATATYSYTFTALAAETEYLLKVVLGDWYGYEKLQTVPDGVENKEGNIAFTLATAGDVVVTYNKDNGINITGNFYVAPTYDYYIAGTLAGGWSATQQGMESIDGVYKHTFTELAAGTYQFKVTNGKWGNEEGGFECIALGATYEGVSIVEGNVQIATEEAKDITVIFDATADEITFEGLTEIEDYYTVVGVAELFGTAWDRANETNKMAKQGDGSYKLVKENVTLAAIGYDWKIAKNGNWWDDAAIGVNPAEGKNNTLTITTAGRYNVTFTLAADFTTATVETELLEAAVVIPDCFISGNKNLTGEETEWQGNEFTMVYDEETETWSYTLAGLQPEKEYALKVVCGGTWYSYANLTSVPAGVAEGNDNAIAFKMAEAGDVTVTYNVEAGITISGNFYEAVKYDYYITGCEKLGANWGANVEAFGMTDENEDKTYEKALTLAAGEYYLKVTDGTWTEGKNWGSAALSGKYTEITDSEGNIKITLTEEKTFTVKFDSETMKISFDGLTPDETPTKYYVVGSFNEWNTTDPNYELILDGEVYKKEVTFAKDVQFKVCDGTWVNSWGKDNLGGKLYNELTEDGDNIKMTEAKTFTIIFDLANNLITFEGLTEKAPAVVTYVLMGVNNDWTTGIALTQNPDNADEYVLENQVIIKATDAIKVVTLEDGVAKAWCGNVDSYSNATYTGGGEDNIVLEDGIYTFYFKKTDNKIYINQTGYARTATPGSFSTICLPYAGTISGATLFNLSDRDANYVYVVEAGTELEAGKPYVILPTEDKIAVTYKNYDYVAAGSYNALYGTYEEMDSDDLDGKYVITGNKYYYVDKVQSAGSTLLANRAYFKLDELQEVAPVLPVGARRIALGTNGQNTATGMENVDASAQPVKTIINGQLYILRGEKMYDAQGKLVK